MPARPRPLRSAASDRTSTRPPQRLNEPVRVRIELAPGPVPHPRVVVLRGRRCPVAGVLERWRVDEGWWREVPVSRDHFRLVLDDGRVVTVYRDEHEGTWWTQRT